VEEAASDARIRPIGRPGDLGWVVLAHGELYAQEFGWDASFEALVAGIVAAFGSSRDRAREQAWVAELEGRRVGCVFCVQIDEARAQLRLLLVHPEARGHGLGRRLVDTCIQFACSAGYDGLRLWTNHPLEAARRIYVERGFVLTHEEAHHSFGADLIGQTYELDFKSAASGPTATVTTTPLRVSRSRH
jgi:GNAT superfamily N-acetyltransferase